MSTSSWHSTVRTLMACFIFGLGVPAIIHTPAVEIDEVSRTIAFLKDGTIAGSGSLFVLSDKLFLVTARHVARVMGTNSQVVVGEDKKGISFSLASLCGVTNLLPWVHDLSNDVSVLMLPSSIMSNVVFKQRFIPASWIPTNVVAPPRSHTLIVMGFPFGIGTDPEFVPPSRSSRAGSGLVRMSADPERSERIVFMLQDPSVAGFSGGPVFFLNEALNTAGAHFPGGPAMCYGIVSGTVSDNTGGKIAEIVPSFHALKLMRQIIGYSP